MHMWSSDVKRGSWFQVYLRIAYPDSRRLSVAPRYFFFLESIASAVQLLSNDGVDNQTSSCPWILPWISRTYGDWIEEFAENISAWSRQPSWHSRLQKVYGWPHFIVYGWPHFIVYGWPHFIRPCSGSLFASRGDALTANPDFYVAGSSETRPIIKLLYKRRTYCIGGF
jgi:hypothetical protein